MRLPVRQLVSMLVIVGILSAGARLIPADSMLRLILLPLIIAGVVAVAFWGGDVPRQPPPGSKPTHVTR
jgi:hypothetical protein